MYFLWEYKSENIKSFFRCGIEQFVGWTDIDWITGSVTLVKIPERITYYCENDLFPEDFPMTGGSQFLISSKIKQVFEAHNVTCVNYYDSCLVQPNGNIIEGYKTTIIKKIINCVDLGKSNYFNLGVDGIDILSFSKVVLINEKIPKEVLLFRLGESPATLLIHKKLKEALEKEAVTGIDFIEVDLV